MAVTTATVAAVRRLITAIKKRTDGQTDYTSRSEQQGNTDQKLASLHQESRNETKKADRMSTYCQYVEHKPLFFSCRFLLS